MNLNQFSALIFIQVAIVIIFLRGFYNAIQNKKSMMLVIVLFLFTVGIFMTSSEPIEYTTNSPAEVYHLEQDYCVKIQQRWYSMNITMGNETMGAICDESFEIDSDMMRWIRYNYGCRDFKYSPNELFIRSCNSSTANVHDLVNKLKERAPSSCEWVNEPIKYQRYTLLYQIPSCPITQFSLEAYVIWVVIVGSVLL